MSIDSRLSFCFVRSVSMFLGWLVGSLFSFSRSVVSFSMSVVSFSRSSVSCSVSSSISIPLSLFWS